ncbi:hypothetical protein GGU10DRAFT_402979, partial [Lentinula aff. detonsa]
LTQLRTGHIPLQGHLHKIKKTDSPTCPCCKQHPKTTFHYLFQCRAHRRPREILRQKVGRKNWNVGALLTEKNTLRHLFAYVDDTKRFYHILGNLPTLPEDQD